MASLLTDQRNGRFIVEAELPNRKRMRLYLGNTPEKTALSVKLRIEHLVAAMLMNAPIDPDSARWVASIDDKLHERIASFGLVRPRVTLQLKQWLTQYLSSRASELKPGSMCKLEQTRDKLIAFFGGSKQLRAITRSDAQSWREWLKAQKLSEATIKTHSGNAKSIMNAAVDLEAIERNPFTKLASGATARKNPAHVTPGDLERVIDACPSTVWKLLFAVAGYLGLRIFSECERLTWDCVDVERSRLRVESPKTERHAGGELRYVPIPPRVMNLILLRYDEMANDERILIPIRENGGSRRKARLIIKAAKVQPWPNLWQTLRASSERNMLNTGIPAYAAAMFHGHSLQTSSKHYANMVPDEIFERVSNGGNPAGDIAGEKALSLAGNAGKSEEMQGTQKTDKPRSCKHLPAKHAVSVKGGRGDLNPRPSGSQPDALTN